ASFGRPGPVNVLRTPRVRVLASCVALVVVTVVSLIAYALLPLRALPDRGSGGRATPASRQPTMTVLQPPSLQQNGPQPSVLKGLPPPTPAMPPQGSPGAPLCTGLAPELQHGLLRAFAALARP